MSFTDGKPFIATDELCRANWGGQRQGANFRCGFCGYRFQVGDRVRWQYTNDVTGASGNPLVCITCDAPRDELVARWKEKHEIAKGHMWWFTHLGNPWE